MRFGRYLIDGAERWAIVGDETLGLLPPAWDAADGLGDPQNAVAVAMVPRTSDQACLPPLPDGARLFCIGRNYRAHAAELSSAFPEHPSVFLRGRESLVGSGAPLAWPEPSREYDYEGEIALVLKQGGRHLDVASATDAIGGYTLVMDGSARDFQRHSLHAGKNFDGSGSMGPWIVTADEIAAPERLALVTKRNGAVVQRGTLAELIFGPAALIAYLSQVTALRPGDIISIGTPAGVGMGFSPPRWLAPGDTLSVEVDEIGVLSNVVGLPRA